ncbi:sulfatase [bacterium]|nr:sulfatase [candidate division CSSED10-310 bacterium]
MRFSRLLLTIASIIWSLAMPLFLTACGKRPAPADSSGVATGWLGEAAGFDVLLITLDTVRANRLGCYGYPSAATGSVDSLCNPGVRFDSAFSSVPLTLPSHATILTGRYPMEHGVRDNGLFKLDTVETSIAERLKSAGYDTAAFIGSFVLDQRFGLAQGFDLYDFEVSPQGIKPQMVDFNERSAQDVTDSYLRWLGERTAGKAATPYFAWLHYFDPHQPYSSPFVFEGRFTGHPYDAEIAYVDHHLGRILTTLEGLGTRRRTLILLTADHGESLGEHGEDTHGIFIYDATIRCL